MVVESDLVVVGGGPAGISAATVAAQLGIRVALVDEQPSLGGRLQGQLYEKTNRDGATNWMKGSDLSHHLVVGAQQAGVHVLVGRAVWGIWPKWTVYINGAGDSRISARALIFATGSTERSFVLPNWTLPGVMTAGAVQSLLHVYRVRPGDSAIIIGADPFAVIAARQLALAGLRVRGVVLPAPGTPCGLSPSEAIHGLARFRGTNACRELNHVGHLLHSKTDVISAADFPLEGVEAWNVPIMLRRAATAILGDERVTGIEVVDLSADGEPVGSPQTWDVDTVVLSAGVSPLCELPQLIGCRMAYVAELGGMVPIHSPHLESTVDGVFLAGSMLGIEEVPVIESQGRLAGLAACGRLGALQGTAATEQLQAAQEALAASRRLACPLLPKAGEGQRRIHELWRKAQADHP